MDTSKLTPDQKRMMIADMVVMQYSVGQEYWKLLGKPLSAYDYNKVEAYLKELNEEYKEVSGEYFNLRHKLETGGNITKFNYSIGGL